MVYANLQAIESERGRTSSGSTWSTTWKTVSCSTGRARHSRHQLSAELELGPAVDLRDPLNDNIIDILTGNPFAFSPNWTVAGGFSYTTSRWSGGVHANWVDEMFADLQNEIELDARTLPNAQIAYRANRFTDRLRREPVGRGLPDDRRPGSVAGDGRGAPGRPAEYGLRVQFGF
ncbi:MAG: TonB-dependent receptor [Acidobacteriota bacterium]